MGNSLENTKPLGLRLPITDSARNTAREFARAQPTPEKADQVLRNSLAVWVMNDYCQMMGITTDLAHSDSWNPITQMMADVADLHLPGIGQLECRPITSTGDRCFMPPDVWDLRVGYVVVELDEHLQQAQLLGFTPSVTVEELPLESLHPLEDLLDRLNEIKQTTSVTTPASSLTTATEATAATVANLGRWLNESFDAGWQAVDALLASNSLTPAMGFRGFVVGESSEESVPWNPTDKIQRAKLVDLAVQLPSQQVVLLVELQPESSAKTHIGVQVHPVQGEAFLPADLELFILEPSDAVFMQAQARQADNYIQLQFSGTPGERFKVRMDLNEARYVEEFVV